MADKEVTSSSRYLYYTDLHYIPEENKTPEWAAQCLVFSKYNCQPLIKSDIVKKFRDVDKGIIDAQPLKEIFDPKDGTDGGKAEFVATDWKSNPICLHLSNIAEANLEKIPLNLNCKAVDEFAKLKQQKDNDKIIMRKAYLDFINSVNIQLGYPILKSTDDPYKYAEQMKTGKSTKGIIGEPTGLVDSIKSMIKDDDDMALYNELIYKGHSEIAIELGIQHYLTDNKFPRKAEQIIADIRNFNRVTLRVYTSQSTGNPVIEYLDLDTVMVSTFSQNDGDDITSWYIEYDVTFRDFVRMFGRGMTKEELKVIFERNKLKYAAHTLEWDRCSDARRDNAKIRIGYHEFLSQNCDVYSKAIIKGNAGFKKMAFDWQPSEKTVSKYKSKRVEKHYNVWYKHYYIPMATVEDNRISGVDFLAQAKYIFDFGKLQDQQRYGDVNQLCKPSLVVWRNTKMSFSEVMDRFGPKIDFLWQQFQNDLANAMPHGLIFAEEMVQLMVNTADDSAKDGKDSKQEFMKKLKQTGYGITRLQNSDGKMINEGKPFVEVKTGHMATARERLLMMMELYNMCRQSLSIDPVSEGVAPKPRTSLGGIQLALDAGSSANWYLEKGFMDVVLEIGNRLLYHIVQIVNENGDRLREFRDIVGAANSWCLESIKDIPLHRLGLSIENINTDQAKGKLMEIAGRLVDSGNLDVEVLYLLAKIDNYKYAAVLMIMKFKQRQAAIEQSKELEFNRQVKLKGMDIEFKKADYFNRAAAESTLLELSKKWDEKIGLALANLKSESQQKLKEITGNNKSEEAQKKLEVKETIDNHKEIMNTT